MYDIRQFKPTLYVVVALGFAGFCFAIGNFALLLLSIGALLLNRQLVRTGKFRPMPHWLANALTLLGFAYVAVRFQGGSQAIILIGEFLLILQIVKLFEQRSNRDYAQLLVLSLLLMVAAIINTASLLVGLIMFAYLTLSTYCCLLFHLKIETEHARTQMGIDERHLNPLTLRQDHRFFNRSMGRFTALVGATSIIVGLVVFLFFPRGPGAGLMFGQVARSMNSQTGFGSEADLQSVSRIQQNTTEVAWVEVTRDGKRLTSGPIYLRGYVYDAYDGDPTSNTRWKWKRTSRSPLDPTRMIRSGNEIVLTEPLPPNATGLYVQKFMPLKPVGEPIIFAMPGAQAIRSQQNLRLFFNENDYVISSAEVINRPLEYEVVSTGVLPGRSSRLAAMGVEPAPQPINSIAIPPQIESYARSDAVWAADPEARNALDDIRPGRPSAANAIVARRIERHLQQDFAYTLDLTAERSISDERDPIVAFLTDFKKGHCEYFASAMVLMCHSLGIPARYVSGYKVDEYNSLGGYFIARQSHAHAWVEVLTDTGWTTFDPTSGNDVDGTVREKSIWQHAKHLMDYLQHVWASNVIAYDSDSQNSLVERVETWRGGRLDEAVTPRRSDRSGWLDQLIDTFNRRSYDLSERIMMVFITIAVIGAMVAVALYIRQRIKLRRRADRIGLDIEDPAERRRLAEQLGFYDQLIRKLSDAGVKRKDHQTPMEFGRSLDFLPAEPYRNVQRLTGIFYRIRFGKAELPPTRRRRLEHAVADIEHHLPQNRS